MYRSMSATLRPARLTRQLSQASGDQSTSTVAALIASRTMLGRRVSFYSSGEHTVEGVTLTQAEQFDSELLRFAHASLIARTPIGDKRVLWVDASSDPIKVVIGGIEGEQYLRQVREAINVGTVPAEMVLDQDPETVPTIKEVASGQHV